MHRVDFWQSRQRIGPLTLEFGGDADLMLDAAAALEVLEDMDRKAAA
jgi:hypothetical protein